MHCNNIQRGALKELIKFLFLFGIVLSLLLPSKKAYSEIDAASKTYTFGILAKRGEKIEKNRFYKLKEYLEAQLPYRIQFLFLPFEELKKRALKGEINFILTNPYQGITIKELADKEDIHFRIILSLGQYERGRYYPYFGGVIFTRKGSPIRKLSDIRGKAFGAVDPESFGGYLIALYELHKAGISEKDIKPKFYGTHDSVVKAVLKGEVPVGTVRTGILERMIETEKISLEELEIINQKIYPEFPLLISSTLYPEWPILALEGTPQRVIKDLARALLEIKEESPLAQSTEAIFYLPFDYSPMHKLLFDLMKGPYAELRELYFQRFKEKYTPYFILLLLFFVAFLSFLAYVLFQRNRLLKETQLDLEKERAFLDTVLRHTDFMAFYLNPEGQVIWANQKGERICLDEKIDKEPLWETCPVINKMQNLREIFKKSSFTQNIYNFVETVEVEDQEKTYEGELIPLKEAEETKGFLFFLRDISEKVIMEKQKLYLEKLNVLRNVAGGLAHDFNNSLLGIINQVELLRTKIKQKRLSVEVKRLFEGIQDSLLNLRILGRELLTLVRGEAPVKEKVNIGDLIRDYTNLALAGKHDYEVLYEIESPLPAVEVDKELFSILWINLVLNAIDAMPKGGRIFIKIKSKVKNGNTYVELSIEDEGSGIEERYLPSIFDPFFTTKPGGSGLGLYVVREVVKAHNGEIRVKSKVGEGTTFTIELPALKGELMPSSRSKKTSSKRVLLMDDDDLIRDTLKELLQSFDYVVETAPDGESALKLFVHSLEKGTPFDYLILDLIVPGSLNGFETYQRIKELYPEVQAILISGYFDEPVMHEYKKYGLKGALIKPFTIQQLLELLE
jgi:signal transduction histidine kinase/ABC-type phosphate/phosphonate transport system substrate-binding protein/CheY-like chemotaxis protein